MWLPFFALFAVFDSAENRGNPLNQCFLTSGQLAGATGFVNVFSRDFQGIVDGVNTGNGVLLGQGGVVLQSPGTADNRVVFGLVGADIPHRRDIAEASVQRILFVHGVNGRAAAEGTSDRDDQIAGRAGGLDARAGVIARLGLGGGLDGTKTGVDNLAGVNVGGAQETIGDVIVAVLLQESADVESATIVTKSITQFHPSQLVVLGVNSGVVVTGDIGTELGSRNIDFVIMGNIGDTILGGELVANADEPAFGFHADGGVSAILSGRAVDAGRDNDVTFDGVGSNFVLLDDGVNLGDLLGREDVVKALDGRLVVVDVVFRRENGSTDNSDQNSGEKILHFSLPFVLLTSSYSASCLAFFITKNNYLTHKTKNFFFLLKALFFLLCALLFSTSLKFLF